jgi:stage II sporulation protein D
LKLALALACLVALGAPSAPAALATVSTDLRVGIARPGGGYTITTMPLEAYVARVVAGEAARDSQPAALEALAIAVRTFALANRGRHRADGFDLCDQTHCQVVRAATAATARAAERTAGRVLLHDGAPASIYFTASCGGRTEIPSAVWPGAQDPPFLPSKPDAACGGAPLWTAELADSDLLHALQAAGFRGDRLRDLRIVAHDKSGRVARLSLGGLTPNEISGQDLRVAVGRTLGWQYIKSTAFELKRMRAAYRFAGHGSGHGVGLCVIGSAHLAVEGKTADEILGRYFPGLEIAPLVRLAAAPAAPARAAPAGVLVSLPDEDEGERASVDEEARRARDDLARTLGVPAPSRITLRFHPTTDSFEVATGQPWFTAGAVVNGELHFTPLAMLRTRGVLARTIRRELVHVMTDAVLARRPLWVREGAAVYFSDTADQAPPQTRAACPTDAELAHPVSVGALSNADARARACFARQIAAGKTWRDVG